MVTAGAVGLSTPAAAGTTTASAGALGHGHTEVATGGSTGTYVVPVGIHKIKHVIIVMQENRSFDTYFGTFPGADGIPAASRQVPRSAYPTPPRRSRAIDRSTMRPTSTVAPRSPTPAAQQSRMSMTGKWTGSSLKPSQSDRGCVPRPQRPSVCRTALIPTSWAITMPGRDPELLDLREDFTLDDHMFEPVASWSLPAHLYMISGVVSPLCTGASPSSCKNDIARALFRSATVQQFVNQAIVTLVQSAGSGMRGPTLRTSLLQGPCQLGLLRRRRKSEPDCVDDAADCVHPPGPRTNQDTWYLESAAIVHRRSKGRPGRRTCSLPTSSLRRRRRTGTLPSGPRG